MGSWLQCGICGEVYPGDDEEAQCGCVTELVSLYGLSDDQRAVALLALTTMRDAGGFGVTPDRLVSAITALSATPIIMERVIGIRRNGEVVPLAALDGGER